MSEPLDPDAIEGDILEYTSADIDETTWEDYIKPQISALVVEVKRLRAIREFAAKRIVEMGIASGSDQHYSVPAILKWLDSKAESK